MILPHYPHDHHDDQADPFDWRNCPNLPSGNIGNNSPLQLDLTIMVNLNLTIHWWNVFPLKVNVLKWERESIGTVTITSALWITFALKRAPMVALCYYRSIGHHNDHRNNDYNDHFVDYQLRCRMGQLASPRADLSCALLINSAEVFIIIHKH